MEDISEILKTLQLEDTIVDNYDNISVFINPNKLPINQVHLTRTLIELRTDINLDNIDDNDIDKYFERKQTIIPALDKLWIPKLLPIYTYEPYNFNDRKDDVFIVKNQLFLKTLNYLVNCNYHQFWCLILFETKISLCLSSFLLNPILPYQLKYLNDNNDVFEIYGEILQKFLLIYQRLITFKQSEEEYMHEEYGLKYLIEKKLINLPIIITLILLYEEIDRKFINNIIEIYSKEDSLIFNKEIDEILNQTIMTLEILGGYICGFDRQTTKTVIKLQIPLAIDEKPTVFSINWLYTIINYLLNTVLILNILLKYYNRIIYKLSFDKGIPYRLTYMYEKIFTNIYQYIDDNRNEFINNNNNSKNRRLSIIIEEEIAFTRSIIVDIFNSFVTYCLDKALKLSGDSVAQQEIVEIYLKLMTTALEDEYFITDYNQKYDIANQNEMFVTCTDLDATRSDYILNCIQNYRRYNRICEALNRENLHKTIKKYQLKNLQSPLQQQQLEDNYNNLPSTSKIEERQQINHYNDDEIEHSIRIINDMFPHLGDGFILQCLEDFNYQTDRVITAILEDNLPPHLNNIPFDTIRIPPEIDDDHNSNKQKILLEYRGKKPTYDDAIKLLNDKKDIREIKTFILDGIEFTNEYDVYDDEYDDRLDEETIKVPDYGNEELLKYNPNHDDDDDDDDDNLSDVNNSDNDHRNGKTIENGFVKDRSRDFCEDPAMVRERREAKRQQNHQQQFRKQHQQQQQQHSRDVVGKQKGQGQENNVLFNRHKKNVNKSARANHSRKSGAQWKRNKGMVPS